MDAISETCFKITLLFMTVLLLTTVFTSGHQRRRKRDLIDSSECETLQQSNDQIDGPIDPDDPIDRKDPEVPFEPEVTDPYDPEGLIEQQVTDPEVTDPEITDPEITDPEITDPEVLIEPEVTDLPPPDKLPPTDRPESKPSLWCKSSGKMCNENIECCLSLHCHKFYNFKKGLCLDSEQWEEYRRIYSKHNKIRRRYRRYRY